MLLQSIPAVQRKRNEANRSSEYDKSRRNSSQWSARLGGLGLDGLGVDGAGAHAEHEHIIIEDIPRRAAFVARLIETI
jgi:acetylornithine deacetylase/succinyl-diaminopimelate desuccinylase-like protein